MTPAEIARASREAQGLPPTIDDSTALDRIVAILTTPENVRLLSAERGAA